jgi:acyl-lipid omega-6 desaturase (Delta-12 desaturase)
MTTPRELDERARREGMTIKRLAAAIPAACYVVDERRSWLALARALALLVAAQALLARVHLAWAPSLAWQLPLLLGLWLFAGLTFAGLFVLGHDCGHGAFSGRRLVNAVVGHLCMGLLMTGLNNWTLGHNHHHKFPNIRKQDTNWPENMVTQEEYARLPAGDRVGLRLAYGSPLGFLLGYWITIVRYVFLARLYPQIPMSPARRRAVLVSNLCTLALGGAIAVALVALGGVGALVKHYAAPMFVAAALGAFLTLLHHVHEHGMYYDDADFTPFRGQVVSTYNVRLPRVVEAMVFDINVHLPHHLGPSIPWYHLRAANDALRAGFPDYVQERPLTLRMLREIWRRPLLERAGDFYRPSAVR